MPNTHTVSREKIGFNVKAIHPKKEPHPVFFLSQRSSFWIATLSVMAFLIGNMMGQHGWHLFWASVLGNSDDSLIVYTGTVAPIEKVPDYSKWSRYGGNSAEHTFRQVPDNVLIDLPPYSSAHLHQSYSVAHKGSYVDRAEGAGSHPGVDIRVPIGTPVVSIANGIVHRIKSGGGFGNVVVVRHPNVPDPHDASKTTTLYSSYAHLDSTLVTLGSVVTKGEQIATSGQTGFASGPHLHFQIDTDDAPWHPYWPFSSKEATSVGLTTAQAVNTGLHQHRLVSYTVNPMLYIQRHSNPIAQTTVVAVADTDQPTPEIVRPAAPKVVQPPKPAPVIFSSSSSVRSVMRSARRAPSSRYISGATRQRYARNVRQKRSARVASRLRNRRFTSRNASRIAQPSMPIRLPSPSPVVTRTEVVTQSVTDSPPVSAPVSTVEIVHDGIFSGRGWEEIRLILKDADGNTVINPSTSTVVHLRTSYGEADFSPSIVSPLDFKRGEAVVKILPRGRRTVVITAQPFGSMSSPMSYSRSR